MDEVSARADMADAVDDARLAVSVPRDEVERILATEEEVDLVLDVVRTNGEREERRIFLAWDRDQLRKLVDESGEHVVITIDPDTLEAAVEADVEAHGVREVGATLAVIVATAGAGAGVAQAHPAEGSTPAGGASTPTFVPGVTDFPSLAATVDTSGFQPGVTDFPQASGAPGAPGAAVPHTLAAEQAAGSDIESIRAGQSVQETPSADIESIRAAQRPAPETGDGGGISIDAPSAGVTAALAGGAALTIAAAAFALRRRREAEPAT
jgi:hypothetical protein